VNEVILKISQLFQGKSLAVREEPGSGESAKDVTLTAGFRAAGLRQQTIAEVQAALNCHLQRTLRSNHRRRMA